MEIRATTILFAKRKAKQKRDEEKELLQQFSNLQEQLRSNFKDTIKTEMDRVKNKLKKITASRIQGAMLRSKARWYEFGEKKNSKYFYNLERRNCKKKHNFTDNGKQYYFIQPQTTVLCKSNESEMRDFRSLSSRTFVEISLENSSVFSRCSERYFAKTTSENSQHFRDHSENSLPEA